jgi:hypothetical protein
MKFSRLALFVAGLSMGAGSALATLLPATFTGVNGATAFGYYVGPYSGTVNGKPVTFYCIDFANHVSFGQSWLANLTVIDGSSGLGNTRYGNLTLYQEAAWLTTQYPTHPKDYGDIQATIWQLFNANAPSPSSNAWLQLAKTNYTTLDFSRYDLVTNEGPVTATGQIQEFLIPVPTPEPGGIILFGTTLILVFIFLRRRLPLSQKP